LLSEVKSVISERESLGAKENTNLLSSRIQSPLYKHISSPDSIADNDHISNEDFSIEKSIKIPYVEKLPSYTSWVHLPRFVSLQFSKNNFLIPRTMQNWLKSKLHASNINFYICQTLLTNPYRGYVYLFSDFFFKSFMLNRNEKMAADQSVIGKEQMYCDINRGEMVLCSDSEEETVNPEDVKHEFNDAEDQILW